MRGATHLAKSIIDLCSVCMLGGWPAYNLPTTVRPTLDHCHKTVGARSFRSFTAEG
jgi:hypothetical protein